MTTGNYFNNVKGNSKGILNKAISLGSTFNQAYTKSLRNLPRGNAYKRMAFMYATGIPLNL